MEREEQDLYGSLKTRGLKGMIYKDRGIHGY